MNGRVTVFGGNGFIGRHLVALLLQSGMAARHPDRVKVAAEATNSLEIVQADLLDETSVDNTGAGAHAVFNLVGILTETAIQTYHPIHVEGARRITLAAQHQGRRSSGQA